MLEPLQLLKRTNVEDLKLGMYVQAMDVPWLDHPFLRSSFLLTSVDQIAEIRRCNVKTVTVDLARSVGQPAHAKLASPDRYSAQRRDKDLQVAKRVTDDARVFIKKVFENLRDGKWPDSDKTDAVIQSIADALDRNRSMLLGLMRIKTRDEYTYFHSVAVGTLMINFARELGLPDDQVRLMGLGGLFHDIGKMQISKNILNKPGRLTDLEFAEIRKHPVLGHEMLTAAGDVPEVALDVCLHHHEKIGGGGYPFGLEGESISLPARMGAICDVYDAITSDRPYKDAVSPIAAVTDMRKCDDHFEKDLLFVFMKSISVFPIGMLIRLQSGHLAIARDNGRRASRARVLVFYAIEERQFVTPYEIFLCDVNVSELVAEAADPVEHGLNDWPGLKQRLISNSA